MASCRCEPRTLYEPLIGAAESVPAVARLYLSMRYEEQQGDKFEDSLQVWTEVATDTSQDDLLRARAALMLAYRNIHLADRDTSERWANLADDLTPEDHSLRTGILQVQGKRLHQAGNLEEARRCLEAAVMAPQGNRQDAKLSVHGWSALGDVCRDQGDLDAAERYYRKGLTTSRSFASRNQYIDELNLVLLDLNRGHLAPHAGRLESLTHDLQIHLWPAVGLFGELVCLTLSSRRGTTAATISKISTELHTLQYSDAELAKTATAVARYLRDRGRADEAELLRRFAADHWRLLGRPDEAEALLQR